MRAALESLAVTRGHPWRNRARAVAALREALARLERTEGDSGDPRRLIAICSCAAMRELDAGGGVALPEGHIRVTILKLRSTRSRR